MTILHRHTHIARRRPRQGHWRGQICRRVQCASGLAYGGVVESTIAEGTHRAHRHQRGACGSHGVIDVLTHKNRPPHGRRRQGLQGRRRAGGGSPFRPLYDDKIMFSGQPIALVLAEDWETARFAASLVRRRIRRGRPYVTDLHAAARSGLRRREAREAARRRRQGLCGGGRAPRGRIFHSDRASQPDGAVCLDRGRGTAAASSRSTTRPRACRMCSAICAACSTGSRTICA